MAPLHWVLSGYRKHGSLITFWRLLFALKERTVFQWKAVYMQITTSVGLEIRLNGYKEHLSEEHLSFFSIRRHRLWRALTCYNSFLCSAENKQIWVLELDYTNVHFITLLDRSQNTRKEPFSMTCLPLSHLNSLCSCSLLQTGSWDPWAILFTLPDHTLRETVI